MDDRKLKINVHSETGTLEAVLLHSPGAEVENMTPQNVQRALYSDILNLSIAQEEYSQLYGVLSKVAKIYEVRPLLEKVLGHEEDKAALLKDIEKCRGAIKKVLPDYNKNLYRFPGGSFLCPSLREAVTRAGYRYYDWNASAGDAEGRYTAKQLFENAIRTSEGKTPVILLMHDGVGYKNTVRALPEIIRRFKNEGYVFKTL